MGVLTSDLLTDFAILEAPAQARTPCGRTTDHPASTTATHVHVSLYASILHFNVPVIAADLGSLTSLLLLLLAFTLFRLVPLLLLLSILPCVCPPLSLQLGPLFPYFHIHTSTPPPTLSSELINIRILRLILRPSPLSQIRKLRSQTLYLPPSFLDRYSRLSLFFLQCFSLISDLLVDIWQTEVKLSLLFRQEYLRQLSSAILPVLYSTCFGRGMTHEVKRLEHADGWCCLGWADVQRDRRRIEEFVIVHGVRSGRNGSMQIPRSRLQVLVSSRHLSSALIPLCPSAWRQKGPTATSFCFRTFSIESALLFNARISLSVSWISRWRLVSDWILLAIRAESSSRRLA